MKSLAGRILTLFTAVMMLLATSGVGIYHHICQMAQKESVSLQKSECCSPVHESGNEISLTSCCHTDFHFLKLNPETTVKSLAKFFLSPAGNIIGGWEIPGTANFDIQFSRISLCNFPSGSPPLFLLNSAFRL